MAESLRQWPSRTHCTTCEPVYIWRERDHECLHDPRCLAAQCPPLASRSVQLRSGRTKVEAHTRRDEVVDTHRLTPFPNYSGRQNPLDGFCTSRLQITSVVVQPVRPHQPRSHVPQSPPDPHATAPSTRGVSCEEALVWHCSH